jgi:hypothetical protein
MCLRTTVRVPLPCGIGDTPLHAGGFLRIPAIHRPTDLGRARVVGAVPVHRSVKSQRASESS